MKGLLIFSSVVLPLLMFLMAKKWTTLSFIFNLVALLSLLIFGNIASISIYKIIRDSTVFMTNIHAIFLNPFFLVTASYLGLYVTYLLLNLILKND